MNTRDMVLIALFAAIVAVLGLVPKIDLVQGVPITAQSLGVMLAGSVLGARRGGLALLLFIVLVAAGLPLLSGGRGGFAWILGAGGGFLLMWPVGAFVVGWLTERWWPRLNWGVSFLANILAGILLLYVVGIPWWSVIADAPLAAVAKGSLAFIPGDLVKAGIAAGVAVAVKQAYPLITPTRN